MPLTMESRKVTTPRMTGRPSTGYLSRTSFSSSTLVTSPSGARTTMACFSGPRMRMPSMSACPPMEVRKACFFSFLAMNLLSSLPPRQYSTPRRGMQHMFYFYSSSREMGSRIVTTVPPPSALAMSKVPSWRRTISSHTARPMPLPRALELPL